MLRERGKINFNFLFFMYPSTELVQFWRLLQHLWCLACHWESPYYLDPTFIQKNTKLKMQSLLGPIPQLALAFLAGDWWATLAWQLACLWRREEWPNAWLNGGAVHVCVWVCNGVICSSSDRESIENGKVNLNLNIMNIYKSFSAIRISIILIYSAWAIRVIFLDLWLH